MNDALTARAKAALTAFAVTLLAAGASHAAAPPRTDGCLSPAAWTALEGDRASTASPSAVLEDMAKRDVVLLGEVHDDDDHHLWQLQALAALQALRPNMAIGFEMFPRRVQPVLDRWVAGELTIKDFLAQSDWDKVWSMSPDAYLPLFQFARINRIPMLALNVDNSLNKAVVEKGWDAVPEAQREGVGRAAPPQAAYLDYLFGIHSEHAHMRGKDKPAGKNDAAFRRFVESQTTWDRAMAEVLARRSLSAAADRPLVVGVMGGGHVRYGYGVPHQLRDLGVKNIGMLLAMPADTECKEIRPGLADAVFALPGQAQEKPRPPRLGIRLERADNGVRILDVTTGSLAERSGLKAGDRIEEVGGLPVAGITPVIAAVRQQPDGSWLPLRVRRGDEVLDMVVKFPPRP